MDHVDISHSEITIIITVLRAIVVCCLWYRYMIDWHGIIFFFAMKSEVMVDGVCGSSGRFFIEFAKNILGNTLVPFFCSI